MDALVIGISAASEHNLGLLRVVDTVEQAHAYIDVRLADVSSEKHQFRLKALASMVVGVLVKRGYSWYRVPDLVD